MFLLAVFTNFDKAILGGYLLLMVAIGVWASRRKTDAEGYFLAERSMPVWMVALSTVATSLSVATFMGAPLEAFAGDLTYLSFYLGALLAMFIVAALFIPQFYRAGTVTIYGYIDQRFGQASRIAVSGMFLIGRLLASGARLFIAAIPICLLLFPGQEPGSGHYIAAICLIGVVGVGYTIAGGIRAVIWTDTIQIIIVMGAVLLSIALLLHKIPLSCGEIYHVLAQPAFADGHSKLRLLSFSWDPKLKFTLWTAVIGGTALNVAAYGVDHDFAQRMLTARLPRRGGVSLIVAQVVNVVVVGLFMIAGLLLYIFYKRPDIMGAGAPVDQLKSVQQVYPQFLYVHLPTGLAGLAMAGMLAAAQGSLDSAINAMASSAVADFYWPIRRQLGLPVETGKAAKAPRLAVAGMGAALILFAVLSAWRYDPAKDTILPFALGVMTFAYSGMLGVFLTALLTRRGNGTSVIAALVLGVLTITLVQNTVAWWSTRVLGYRLELAEFWWLPIGATVSFLTCVAGKPQTKEPVGSAEEPPRVSISPIA